MIPPRGIAKFDSSAAMLQALARFLAGKDFAGLGQPSYLQTLTRAADIVPRKLRERAYAHLGAQEGVPPDRVDSIRSGQIAKWIADQYPRRRYPAVMIGSS